VIHSDQCRIRITALDGTSNAAEGSSPGFFHITTSTTGAEPIDTRPTLRLGFPHPNPFGPLMTVACSLPAREDLDLSVYDVRGRKVRTLVSDARPMGPYTASWDGRGRDGTALAPGIYFVRLESGGEVITRKALLRR